MTKGFTRKFKPLEILTDEQVEAIHKGTLDVLRETGVRFESERALKIFEEGGCKVDHNEMRVRFPEALVEECLRKCPSSFRVKARDPKNDLVIGGNSVYFTNCPGMNTVNLDNWEPRPATRKEYYDMVTVLDALDTVHFICCYPYFGFAGLSPVMAIPEGVAAKLRNSTKFQQTCYQHGCEKFNIEMAKVAGTEILGDVNVAPPLTYYGDAFGAIYGYAKAGFPIMIASGCVHGGTGPATIAGSIITDNAEYIAGIVLIQLIKPGTRVITMDQTTPQNMQTGSPFFDAIGCSLHMVAGTQVWRRYEIPHGNANPGYSSSKKIDLQNGYERAINAFATALCGGNNIQFHSGIHGELTAHPVQAILDDDIAGMIGRFIEGIEVTDETLAIDLIEEVGPVPGHYLNKEHTRRWWKKEQFVPKVADRLTYPEWLKKGKKSALDYAKERMEEILRTHEVSIPLTPEQDKEIEKILGKARKEYKEKGLF